MLTSPLLYIPAALIAAIGLYALYRALLRDRAANPRCPKCWYNLSGALSPSPESPCICPECGTHIVADRDLYRTRRHVPLTLLAILLFVPLLAYSVYRGDARRAYYALPPHWLTDRTEHLGAATITLQSARNPDLREQRITISHAGKTLFNHTDARISLGLQDWTQGGTTPVIRGFNQDLNGDGAPELIIEAYSGGAHCCFTIFLFELPINSAEPPRLIAAIEAPSGIALVAAPKDSAYSGQMLLNIPDPSFLYWNAPYVASPHPSVFYTLKDHHLRIAPELLQLSLVDIARLSGESTMSPIRTSMIAANSQLNPDLWDVMLTFLYANHYDDAMRFLDQSWPATRPGKDDFKKEFLEILGKSPQYQDFKAARAALSRNQPVPAAHFGTALPKSP